MIIYNMTIKVDPSIHQGWLTWLKEEHIPAILNTGCFTNAKVLRLLETDDSDGPTYAVQYYAESKAEYNRYMETFAGKMRQRSFEKWSDQFIAFSSVMQVVN